MKRITTSALFLATALASSTAYAQSDNRRFNFRNCGAMVLTPSEATVIDAVNYAYDHGVDYMEAMHRMFVLDRDLSAIDDLGLSLGDDFAGVFVDNSRDGFRIRMRRRGTAGPARMMTLPARPLQTSRPAGYETRAEKRARRLARAFADRQAWRTSVRRFFEDPSRPFVRIPRNAVDASDTMFGSDLSVDVEFIGDQTLSESEINSLIASRTSSLEYFLPEIAAIGYDPDDDSVLVLAPVEGELSEDMIESMSEDFGYDVSVIPIDGAPELDTLRGGGSLFVDTVGSQDESFFMTGFAVTVGFVDAMLTAGHCYISGIEANQYADRFSNREGVEPILTSIIYGPDGDLVAIEGDSGVSDATFVADDSGIVRGVFGAVGIDGTNIKTETLRGSYICHYSTRTGQTCGEVYGTQYVADFNPTSAESTSRGPCGTFNFQGPCNPEFGLVIGSSLRRDAGDSGGPWFANNTAYGTHVGGGPTKDGRVYSYYMPIDKFSEIGATLKQFNF